MSTKVIVSSYKSFMVGDIVVDMNPT